jgi:hypothetical protein
MLDQEVRISLWHPRVGNNWETRLTRRFQRQANMLESPGAQSVKKARYECHSAYAYILPAIRK